MQKETPASVRRLSSLCAILLLITAVLTGIFEYRTDPVLHGYLQKNQPGGTELQESFIAETEDGSEKITVTLPAAEPTPEEAESFFREAEAAVRTALPEDGAFVTGPLALPASLPGNPVEFSYATDRPEILGSDGVPGNEPGGGRVCLTAELSLPGRQKTFSYFLRVLPARSGHLADAVLRIIGSADPSARKIELPQSVGGKTVSYRRMPFRSSLVLLVLALLALPFGPLLWKSRIREAAVRRREELLLDYPGLTDTLTLYLLSGMSLSRAVRRLALSYEKEIPARGHRPGYDVLLAAFRDTKKGVSEAEALRGIGQRAGIPEYRTFASLLVQCLEKGGPEVLGLIRKEAAAAAEERIRKARIRGEKASTQLLLPMTLMLGIVLAVLIIPACINLM